MARARPVCAMTARRLACALFNTASVATTTSVVLSRALPLVYGSSAAAENAGGSPRPPNSPSRSHGEAAVLLLEPALHAGGGIEAERRAAGERDRVDAFDRLRRIEQRGLARARSAAAHVDRADRGHVEHDRGGAGAEAGVLGVAYF